MSVCALGRPYLSTLPTTYHTVGSCWTPRALALLARTAPDVAADARETAGIWARGCDALLDACRRSGVDHLSARALNDDELRAVLRWAWLTQRSRAFSHTSTRPRDESDEEEDQQQQEDKEEEKRSEVDGDSGEDEDEQATDGQPPSSPVFLSTNSKAVAMCMPLVDMCNHNASATVARDVLHGFWEWADDSDPHATDGGGDERKICWVLRAKRRYRAGEQLYITYGKVRPRPAMMPRASCCTRCPIYLTEQLSLLPHPRHLFAPPLTSPHACPSLCVAGVEQQAIAAALRLRPSCQS